MIGLGAALIIFNQRWVIGGVVAFIGWVSFIASLRANLMMRLRYYLLNTRLSDIILPRDCPQISLTLTIRQLVSDHVLTKGQYFFVAIDDNKPVGYITLSEIRKIPKKNWDRMTVEQACVPATIVYRASAEQSAADVLEQMLELEIEQMPVVLGNNTIGLIDRDDLLHLARIRRELKSLAPLKK